MKNLFPFLALLAVFNRKIRRDDREAFTKLIWHVEMYIACGFFHADINSISISSSWNVEMMLFFSVSQKRQQCCILLLAYFFGCLMERGMGGFPHFMFFSVSDFVLLRKWKFFVCCWVFWWKSDLIASVCLIFVEWFGDAWVQAWGIFLRNVLV